MTKTVGEDFPRQQARVRKIRGYAAKIPSGLFLTLACDQALEEAEKAAMSGDVVRIISAYTKLKGFEE